MPTRLTCFRISPPYPPSLLSPLNLSLPLPHLRTNSIKHPIQLLNPDIIQILKESSRPLNPLPIFRQVLDLSNQLVCSIVGLGGELFVSLRFVLGRSVDDDA